MKTKTNFRSSVSAALSKQSELLLRPGDYFFTCPERLALKSFRVYIYDWLRNQNFEAYRLAVKVAATRPLSPVRGVTITVYPLPGHQELELSRINKRLRGIAPIIPSKPPEPVAPPPPPPPPEAPLSDGAVLELWAQHCLAKSIPLEDVLAHLEGRIPNFLPMSPQGLELVQALQAKGQ